MEKKTYSYDETFNASLEYFNGDDLAAKVFADKYALTDGEGNYFELTPDDMHKRLAKEFARIEKKYPNPMSEEEIYGLMKGFSKVIPQGSPMSGIGNDYQIQSVGNCFVIQQPWDSYSGILKSDQELAQLFKRRAGCGVDISRIRPQKMRTSNASRTTEGIVPFMERYSSTCREVAIRARRGALMITIDCRHPQILDFIKVKRDLKKVTGANISVKITDEFMRCVKNKKKFQLKWPVDNENPSLEKKIDATEIWDELIKSNHIGSEPGVLFFDTITRRSPADSYAEKDERFRTCSTNPCLAGDVKIATEEGMIPIKELAEKGEDVPVYTLLFNGEVGIRMMRQPRKTGFKEVFKVILDGGETFKATENHKILSKDNEFKEIRELKIGDDVHTGFKNETSIKNSFPELKEEEDNENNRKIIFIEQCGHEDVYNGTVDETHNFYFGGWEGKDKNGEEQELLMVSKNCGEIPLGEDSCRLTLINLSGFVLNPFTKKAKFDFKNLKLVSQKAMRIMDNLVDIEIEQIDKIINKIKKDPEPDNVKKTELDLWKNFKETAKLGRRTGLGITAIGDVIAMLNLSYSSDEAVKVVEKIYKTIAVNAYKSSCLLAKERGTFPLFEKELESKNEFIEQVLSSDNELKDLYEKYGRRNISILTTAPAGSVSILSQTTSGIEPVFKLKYTRRKKINPGDQNSRVDFTDDLGDRWQHFNVYHHGVKKWMDKTGETNIEKSPYFGSTAEELNWESRVKLQSVATKWLDHSLSSTINLPENVSVDEVKKIYMQAWESGCKGITIYREGSRTGVLVDSSKLDKTTQNAQKRPDKLPCDIHHVRVNQEDWIVVVGMMNNSPYEIFGGYAKFVEIPKKYSNGELIKHHRKTMNSRYDLRFGFNGDSITLKDIVKQFENPTFGSMTRMISLSLRHNVPINFVVEQLQKNDNEDLFSFAKVIARVLKKYIKDGTKASVKNCSQCKKENSLIYQEGCLQCMNCGYSKCG